MESESIGPLKIGLMGDIVMQIFGQPDSIGPIQMSQATGNYTQNLNYTRNGITYEMESHDFEISRLYHFLKIYGLCVQKKEKPLYLKKSVNALFQWVPKCIEFPSQTVKLRAEESRLMYVIKSERKSWKT